MFLSCGFKGVPEKIPSEEANTLQIWSVAFLSGQSTSLQLYPCHSLFYQDGHQDSLSPTYSPKLAPCDFWLFPKLRGCSYVTIEEIKEAVTKVIARSHKITSMGPSRSYWNGTTSSLQPEEITSNGTRVSCVYYQQKCSYEKRLETYRMHLVLLMEDGLSKFMHKEN